MTVATSAATDMSARLKELRAVLGMTKRSVGLDFLYAASRILSLGIGVLYHCERWNDINVAYFDINTDLYPHSVILFNLMSRAAGRTDSSGIGHFETVVCNSQAVLLSTSPLIRTPHHAAAHWIVQTGEVKLYHTYKLHHTPPLGDVSECKKDEPVSNSQADCHTVR